MTLMPFLPASDSTRSKRCRDSSSYVPTCEGAAHNSGLEKVRSHSARCTHLAVRSLQHISMAEHATRWSWHALSC